MLCTGRGYFQNNWMGTGVCNTLPETLNYLAYFRKSVIFPTLFQTWPLNKYLIFYLVHCISLEYLLAALVYSFRSALVQNTPGARRVTGARYKLYKREMVLSPNDEEVASSKRHTQFKTRVYKSCPISDQNGQNWYSITDKKTYPFALHMPI